MKINKDTHMLSSAKYNPCIVDYSDPHLLVNAFCTFVRPILEYCCTVWNPRHKYEIEKIEAIQRRFTKRLRGFYHMSYTNS